MWVCALLQSLIALVPPNIFSIGGWHRGSVHASQIETGNPVLLLFLEKCTGWLNATALANINSVLLRREVSEKINGELKEVASLNMDPILPTILVSKWSGWLKEIAPLNMLFMFSTRGVSKWSGWLKVVASLNTPIIRVTRDVCQWSGWLNDDAPANILSMLSTLDVSKLSGWLNFVASVNIHVKLPRTAKLSGWLKSVPQSIHKKLSEPLVSQLLMSSLKSAQSAL